MSDIKEQSKQTYVGEIFEGYEIDLTPLGTSQVFHLSSTIRQPTSWRGKIYQPFPVLAEGFVEEKNSAPSRINLTVSNVNKTLMQQVAQYDDLVGANVTIWRTYKNFLDGEVDADPNQHFPTRSYVIIQKQLMNESIITFLLSSKMDRPGLRLPRRQILREDLGERSLYAPGVSRLRKF